MIDRQVLHHAVDSIEDLPVAAVESLSVIQDPDAQISDIAQIVQRDPAIATNLLKLANSALYAGPRKIDSIQEAISRLGLQQLGNLVMQMSVAPVANVPVQGYDLPAGSLWRSSLAMAIGSTHLAQCLGRKAPPVTYTACLLCDIGKIVLGSFVQADCQKIRRVASEDQISFEQAEIQVLGFDHTYAGSKLLEKWHLPQSIVQLVQCHHQPSAYAGDDQLAMDLVHAASNMIVLSGLGGGVDGTHYDVSDQTIQRLGLTQLKLEEALCKTMSDLEKVSESASQAVGS